MANRNRKSITKAVSTAVLTPTPNTSSIDLSKSTDIAAELQSLHNLNQFAQSKIAAQAIDLEKLNEIVDIIQKELSTLPPKITWWWIVTHVDELVSLIKYIIAVIRNRPTSGL